MDRLRGRWTLVTGASSGIGAAFCRRLARAGCHVVLVARREERLKALAIELEQDYGVMTRLEVVDLIAPGAIQALYGRIREAGLEIDLLVNNAGFGIYGDFKDSPWSRDRDMLALDVMALTELTKTYLADMLRRDRGWIIEVASVAAYQPIPTYAAYAAAKAYVLSFGEALAYELRDSEVNVSVLSPGIADTEFFAVAGQSPGLYHKITRMSVERAVDAGLRAVLSGRSSVLPGAINKLGAFCTRLLPRRIQSAITNWLMRSDRSEL